MATVTQYKFDMNEIAEMLVKKQGLHEGRWLIGVEFGFGAALTGSSADKSLPTAMIQVGSLLLNVAPPEAPDGIPGLVDAAKVNPARV